MTIPSPPLWVLDIECYVNYFLVLIRNVYSGDTSVLYERFNDETLYPHYCLDPFTYITFNGNNYDMPMLALALTGASNATLKRASDAIIVGGLKPWDMEREFGFERLVLDHIDLIEVAPGRAGLKIYGGRLHSKRLQDLPIEPSAHILPSDVAPLREYCGNDLLTTIDLYNKLKPQLDLRIEMSKEFGIDLRSKSDAQIAEAVIKSEVEKCVGHKIYKPDVNLGLEFAYTPPSWIGFGTDGMNRMLDMIRAQTFKLNRVATKDQAVGSVIMPPALDGLRIRIGRGVYRMGIGGLHSSESCVSYRATPDMRIVDRDVTSYYPSLIINSGVCPSALGASFQPIYQGLKTRRVQAKEAGRMVASDGLKIVLNGSFGKFGSMYSVMYGPDQMIAVTLTGQLALLMLIESLDANGIEVISANTDGVVSLVHDAKRDLFEALIAAWEITTGLNTEETQYKAIYSANVNNYFAIKTDGKVKPKGLYSTVSMSKNPTNTICVEAVIAYLTAGTPVSDTVRACTDITKFLTIRQVNGGAMYGDQFLGKAVRWYYASGETRCVTYKTNGNKVARSDGARPLMQLSDGVPGDLDYDWYIKEGMSILGDIGA